MDFDDSGMDVDVLNIQAGLAVDDVTVSSNQDDPVLTINGSSDQVAMSDFFRGGGVHHVQFADGTVWDRTTLKDRARVIVGTSGLHDVLALR